MLKGMENWNMKAKVPDIFEMANVLKFSDFNFTLGFCTGMPIVLLNFVLI